MSLPAIPAELLHLCETEREAVRRYAEAYALQAVEALRREPMTEEQAKQLLKRSDLLDMFLHIGWYSAPRKGFDEHALSLIRTVEAHHHITQKEQG